MENLKAKVFEIRENILDMVYRAKAGHIGGGFIYLSLFHIRRRRRKRRGGYRGGAGDF